MGPGMEISTLVERVGVTQASSFRLEEVQMGPKQVQKWIQPSGNTGWQNLSKPQLVYQLSLQK